VTPRTVTHVSWWLAALLGIAVTGQAVQVVTHAWLAALVGLAAAAGAYTLGRRHGARHARRLPGPRSGARPLGGGR